MKKLLLVLFVLFFVGVFSYVSVSEEVRDGSSIEKAVIVTYTGNYQESIGQEYRYIAEKFGTRDVDYELLSQRLVDEGGTPYDVITIRLLPSGEERDVYFDITELRAAWGQ